MVFKIPWNEVMKHSTREHQALPEEMITVHTSTCEIPTIYIPET